MTPVGTGKILNNSVVIGEEGDEEEKIWAGRVLLLFLCFVKRDTESLELAFVKYVECVMVLDAGDEGLGLVCLWWETADVGEDESRAGRSVNENGCTVRKGSLGAT